MNFYQIKSERALTTLRDGAPNFIHSFGAIAAGANEYVVVNETIPRARKYQPLTSVVITNNDTTATSAGEVFMNLTKPPMSQSDFTRLENLYR